MVWFSNSWNFHECLIDGVENSLLTCLCGLDAVDGIVLIGLQMVLGNLASFVYKI